MAFPSLLLTYQCILLLLTASSGYTLGFMSSTTPCCRRCNPQTLKLRPKHIAPAVISSGFTLLAKSNTSTNDDNDTINEKCNDDDNDVYTLTVSHDGLTTKIRVHANESILTALEGSQQLLGLMPFDCRQGNCLTCVATHAPESLKENIVFNLNGLTPTLSVYAKKKGYVLTCSSRVCGNGVHLHLDKCHEAWQTIHQARLLSRDVQETAMAAMAKTIRQSNERNLQRWKNETETLLK